MCMSLFTDLCVREKPGLLYIFLNVNVCNLFNNTFHLFNNKFHLFNKKFFFNLLHYFLHIFAGTVLISNFSVVHNVTKKIFLQSMADFNYDLLVSLILFCEFDLSHISPFPPSYTYNGTTTDA